MEILNIKPNYSELARIYECDRRTRIYQRKYKEKKAIKIRWT